MFWDCTHSKIQVDKNRIYFHKKRFFQNKSSLFFLRAQRKEKKCFSCNRFLDRQVHQPFPFLAYISPVLNMSDILEIQRGHFLNDRGSLFSQPYEPPPLELYTYISRAGYFWIFLSLHFIQIVVIYFIKQCWIKSTSSLWETFLTSVVQSHWTGIQHMEVALTISRGKLRHKKNFWS